MKRILHSLFLSAVLLFNALFISSITFAQNTNVPAIDQAQTQPGTGAITNDTAAATTATDTGFNPLWLLPLIAIPLLAYLLWPRDTHEEIHETSYSSDYAGAKGGRAEKDQDDDRRED